MKLRPWQDECIGLALSKYQNKENHFLVLATPGAGKTIMASELANLLLKKDLVDLVLCFSPSAIVAKDFSTSLQNRTQERFDGLIGAKGRSLTYQSLQYLSPDFWSLFDRYRVFIIFDEIHHCSGTSVENSNSWGEQIIVNIQNKAKYTLALTGTPWRSDSSPIVLSKYADYNQRIVCDYVYGLSKAISENVCRVPSIITVDNNNISVTEQNETKTFNNFNKLLSDSDTAYQYLIENDTVIHYIITQAQQQLNHIRQDNPNAAGLIVASSVEHAHKIQNMMQHQFKENAVTVTYRESNAAHTIQQFRASKTKWIISVGMISEGTNIPRLQVCCHLSNIRTELHFRQILGRILRITNNVNQQAIMFVPAEAKLLEFARRVELDIPHESGVVKLEVMNGAIRADRNSKYESPKKLKPLGLEDQKVIKLSNDTVENITQDQSKSFINYITESPDKDLLTRSYERVVNIYGRFIQESISLNTLR